MFRKTNEEIDLKSLSAFIEKPSQEFKEESELTNEINKVIVVLETNPSAIIDIIKNHPYIPATFLLDDLADKMKKQHCLAKLEILFDKHPDELVSACIYNLHDLERCLNALPAYSDKIMQHIISNDDYIKKIFANGKIPEETINECSARYPMYADQLSECYKKCFKSAPTP